MTQTHDTLTHTVVSRATGRRVETSPSVELRLGAAVDGWPPRLWLAAGLAVLATAVAWVQLTGMAPSYDAFGWLTWGQQVLHWNLNTDGAPSWKPLPFLFTLPYALVGRDAQVWLWMVTAAVGALMGSVFAGRIAFRLTGPSPERWWAPWCAAAFAAVGVLGISGYSELVLIANSDPLVMSLCLATIDMHLSGRRRLAFVLLVLVSFGRPEGWPFAAAYALWLWLRVPGARVLATVGIVLIPLAWFVIPGLTSRSWFSAGDLALNAVTVIHGDKVTGVIGRLLALYEWPVWVAVALALVIALARRERAALLLAGTAAVWAMVEIGLALHGWSAAPRYLIEPMAVFVVLGGVGVGWSLAYVPQFGGSLVRWLPTAAVVAILLALVPTARSRARVTHGELHAARHARLELTRLQAVVRAVGGGALIRRCGQPVTLVGKQSEVAWAVGTNVGDVGYHIGVMIDRGIPIVVLKPHDDGWQVRPFHTRASMTATCSPLRMDSAMGPS